MAQVVLITGGSRGIGQACVEYFARQGDWVAFCYRHEAQRARELSERLREAGGQVWAMQADVTRRDQVEVWVQEACRRFGRVDVLINNAGISRQQMFNDITPGQWDEMMDVHVKGCFHTCQAVLPGMIARKEGKIINITSIWGLTGAACEVHYSAAKAAVIGLTRALAKEVAPSNIQVNAVAPGAVDTDMNAHLDEASLGALCEQTPLGRLGTCREIAQCVGFLASKQADFFCGQILSPNGGLVV